MENTITLTDDPRPLPPVCEASLPQVGREVGGVADLRAEGGLLREEVEEEARGLLAVVHDHGLHELVVALHEVLGLAEGEAARRRLEGGRAGLKVGAARDKRGTSIYGKRVIQSKDRSFFCFLVGVFKEGSFERER